MKFTPLSEMPRRGQFVAFWKDKAKGKPWSGTYRASGPQHDRVVEVYDEVTDRWHDVSRFAFPKGTVFTRL